VSALLSAEGVTKLYRNGVRALDGVTLSLREGELVTLVGRSGSGKSTLLHILGGLDTPTAGTVRIQGRAMEYGNPRSLVGLRRTTIGFIFQAYNLISHLTARQNVEYPLLFQGIGRVERGDRAEQLLGLVGLGGRASHYPSELSGGEQQRVAIARALVHGPALVLADEPTGNLDSRTRDEILGVIRELNRSRRTTFLIVTHEAGIARFADRSIELLDGRVAA
jgi:putative ABC transport system ATP-binding protein